MTNIITGANVADSLNSITAKKEEKIDIKDLKSSISYVRGVLRKDELTGMVKVKATNLKHKIMFSIKFMGRLYLEDFSHGTDFNEIAEKIISRINTLLKVEEDHGGGTMNHKDRRKHLRNNTDYFKNKKKKSFNEWCELVRNNNKAGKERKANYLDSQIKRNIEFLVDREISYRSLLSKLGHDGQEIENHVADWYSKAIKEDSFMSEK